MAVLASTSQRWPSLTTTSCPPPTPLVKEQAEEDEQMWENQEAEETYDGEEAPGHVYDGVGLGCTLDVLL